ncbi:MAG: hypothetical protein QW260_08395 [Thermoproteota archaeon]
MMEVKSRFPLMTFPHGGYVELVIYKGGEEKYGFCFQGKLPPGAVLTDGDNPAEQRFFTEITWGYSTLESAAQAGYAEWDKIISPDPNEPSIDGKDGLFRRRPYALGGRA